MGKVDSYRTVLRSLTDWDDYLRRESGLPGPRSNLELMQAVVDEGDRALFERLSSLTPLEAPENTPDAFLACCGVVGLGRILAEGEDAPLPALRLLASDPRWRVREAVAMALQRLGDANMGRLLAVAADWAEGNPYEQRAAAAGICEPRLLRDPDDACAVLGILDAITTRVALVADRRDEAFLVLRKGLSYCWSVAVAALPEAGKRRMERWFGSADPDVRRIMKENLAKNRLLRMDPKWVEEGRNGVMG